MKLGDDKMNSIMKEISKIGIVPVIKLENPDQALPVAKALLKGGLPCAEVTFRTDAAGESIRRISEKYPDMLVGAGTVLTTEQVDEAVRLGAKFIVSPGLNPNVVRYCQEKGIPIAPGCCTPSDIEAAIGLGLDVVKFFPAEASGGIKMIKALAGPYTTLKFMPTGGISESNLNDYLDYNRIIACGGSWMVKSALIDAGRFDEIESLTRDAVHTMLGFEVKHIGINSSNEKEASETADTFGNIFGFERKDGHKSIFAGGGLEIMKLPFLGKNGHIAVQTNSIERAMYHLGRKGIEFDEASASCDDKGNIKAIYLKHEINGFAIHLVAKKN